MPRDKACSIRGPVEKNSPRETEGASLPGEDCEKGGGKKLRKRRQAVR